MVAAALDAIHEGELNGHEWRSRLLDNCNALALDNNGCDWTFIWHLPKACARRLRDEMDAAFETKAKKQRIDKQMVATPEKSEVSEKSQASDAFEESAQEGRAAPEKSGASEASEASDKSVETGYVIKNHLAVNPSLFTQPSSKFVDDAAPTTLELYHRDYKMAQLAMRGLACQVEAPTHATMDRLRHLVRCFFGAKLYQNMMTPGDKRLICVWSDSDWAGDRQSQSSVDCAVLEVQNSWAEWFGETLPIHLMMDSAVGKITSLRRGKGKVRHLEVKQLYLQHLTNAQRVKLHNAKGDDNKSDVGTQSMTARQIEKFYDWLGVWRPGGTTRGEENVKAVNSVEATMLAKFLAGVTFATQVTSTKGTRNGQNNPDISMTTGPQGSGYEIMVIIVMAIVMAWLLGVMCGGFAMHWFVRRSIPLGTTTTTTSSTRVLMKDKETEMEAGTTSSMTSSSTLWVTAHGERFHVDAECKGLRGARSLKNVTRCMFCG